MGGAGKNEAVFHFKEQKPDNAVILLKDDSRNVTVQMQINGAMSKLSIDDGVTWRDLYELQKEDLSK